MHIDHTAAIFIDLAIIGHQPDFKIAAGFKQHLPAHEPAVPLIGQIAGGKVFVIAIALVVSARQTDRYGFAQWAGDHALDDHGVIIAIAGFNIAAEGEFGCLGNDRDDTRRCVFAEQR